VIETPRPARHRTYPLPQGQEKARAVEAMFDRIAPRYDLLNRLLSFRMDVAWRRAAVHSLELVSGSRVLDLACGTGDLCRTVRADGYRPVGVDFSAGMLAAARVDAPLVRADAARLPFADGAFDGVTCGFALRNFVDLAAVLAECARTLRPRGRLALVDVSEPTGGPARTVHRLWFRHVVPFVGGVISDRSAYAYLPASTAYLPPRAQLLELVGAGGFAGVSHRTLGVGAAQLITGTRV
jgi:demethylmenaquinone methyltransferase/2-methoxy-6-polyprenyl-1,4-benzoquinol methylase